VHCSYLLEEEAEVGGKYNKEHGNVHATGSEVEEHNGRNTEVGQRSSVSKLL